MCNSCSRPKPILVSMKNRELNPLFFRTDLQAFSFIDQFIVIAVVSALLQC